MVIFAEFIYLLIAYKRDWSLSKMYSRKTIEKLTLKRDYDEGFSSRFLISINASGEHGLYLKTVWQNFTTS